MFKTSEGIKNITAAILKAEDNFSAILKSADNPYFKSKYADLNAILAAVKPALKKEGVKVYQPPVTDGTANFVTTRLVHADSGEWLESTMKLEMSKVTMQEAGSGVSYGRRYTLQGLLGLETADDDGNAASGKKVEPQASKPDRTPITTTLTPEVTTAKKGPGRPAKTNSVVGTVYGTNGKTVNKPVEVTEEEW
jgi:ERF superfamily protein